MFNKKTIKDIEVRGQRVLLRVDYNVPLIDGKVADDYRVVQSLPTIKYLLEQGARLVVCSHLGRPDGLLVKELSLAPVAELLAKLLNKPVEFVPDQIDERLVEATRQLEDGQIMLLENIRFNSGEESNDPDLIDKLASLADIFVQDAFGVVHHGAASVSGVAAKLPAVAGLLVEKECQAISQVMSNPKRPLLAIIGGAKISDKVEVINRFIEIADVVVLGGAMANTFMAAEGIDVAKSLVEREALPIAKDILNRAKEKSDSGNFVFYLPQDSVVAKKIDKHASTRIVDWYEHRLADIVAYPRQAPVDATELNEDELILDIGPCAASFIAGAIQLAGSVVWNGTLGVTEVDSLQGAVGPFAQGTDLVVEAMLGRFGNKPYTVVGGGDTVSYVESRELTNQFGHVSTGGGASLELMAGRSLPGIDCLEER